MRHTTRKRGVQSSRMVPVGLGGLLFLSGYLTALWVPFPPLSPGLSAQAAEGHKGHEHAAPHAHHTPHEHPAHGVLIPFMIRNAYHFSTLYHAGRATRWELAAHEAEGLEDNLLQAVQVAGPYAQFLRDFLKDYVEPLQHAISARQAEQFHAAFQAAVGGCNDCHRATQHAFIVIPPEPPALSIFAFPPPRQ